MTEKEVIEEKVPKKKTEKKEKKKEDCDNKDDNKMEIEEPQEFEIKTKTVETTSKLN